MKHHKGAVRVPNLGGLQCASFCVEHHGGAVLAMMMMMIMIMMVMLMMILIPSMSLHQKRNPKEQAQHEPFTKNENPKE